MTVWQDIFAIFVNRNRQLARIADALERIAPEPESPVQLKPDEQVTYVDEEHDALREQREEASALARHLEEHPEEAEVLREGYGEGDVF